MFFGNVYGLVCGVEISATRSEDLDDEQIGCVGRREDATILALAEGV